MSQQKHIPDSVQQQGFGYRRGFVLGLTLAETALLLLFVLMLLMVIGFDRRDRLLAEARELENGISGVIPPNTEPASYVIDAVQKYQEMNEIILAAGEDWDENFLELVKATAQAARGESVADLRVALEEKQAQLDRMLAQVESIQNGASIEDIVGRVTEQEAVISNQRGQLVDLRARLGSGVFPNCWTREDGKFDYLLDIVLASEGIRARESVPAERMEERTRLPLPPMIDVTRVYSESEFLAETRAVYNWSVEQECRFYITIYDATQPHEKERYKNLMQTVEGHFYKREEKNATAPF